MSSESIDRTWSEVGRSSSAVIILGSLKALRPFPDARLVVTTTEVCSWRRPLISVSIVGTFSRRRPEPLGSGWTNYLFRPRHPHSRPHSVPRSGDSFKPKTARFCRHAKRRADRRLAAVRLLGEQREFGAAKYRLVANRELSHVDIRSSLRRLHRSPGCVQ